MAEFDPDAFLKGTPSAAPAFDPDSFLKGGTATPEAPSREKELRAEYLKSLMAPGEPGYSQRLKDSATLGLVRPLGGVMRGISGLADPTSSFGERYRAGVGAEEDYAKRAVENTPGAAGVATDIAGGAGASGGVRGVLSAGAALPAVAGRDALAGMIKQGAVTGAVEGAARNAEDPESALKGGAAGGVLGAGTAAAVGGAAKLIPGVKGAQKELREVNQGRTPEELKAAAKKGYQELDNAGIAYAQPQTATLKAGLDDLKATNQYNPIAHQKISDYVDQLDRLAQHPAGAKFSELHNLRSALATEARGSDPATRVAAGKIIGEVDKLVQGNAPALNPNNIDIKNIYPDATRLWKAAAIADDVSYVAGRAERKAASKAGVNPDEANRAAFRPLLEKTEKPGAYSPFKHDAEQRDLLAKIVHGDKTQNMLRGAGAVVGSPITRGLAGMAATGLGVAHGGIGLGVGSLGLGAAGGGAAKALLDRMAAARGEANIDALLRNITTGSSKPTNQLPSPEALRTLLAKQAAQRGGAAYAGSATGE